MRMTPLCHPHLLAITATVETESVEVMTLSGHESTSRKTTSRPHLWKLLETGSIPLGVRMPRT